MGAFKEYIITNINRYEVESSNFEDVMLDIANDTGIDRNNLDVIYIGAIIGLGMVAEVIDIRDGSLIAYVRIVGVDIDDL